MESPPRRLPGVVPQVTQRLQQLHPRAPRQPFLYSSLHGSDHIVPGPRGREQASVSPGDGGLRNCQPRTSLGGPSSLASLQPAQVADGRCPGTLGPTEPQQIYNLQQGPNSSAASCFLLSKGCTLHHCP